MVLLLEKNYSIHGSGPPLGCAIKLLTQVLYGLLEIEDHLCINDWWREMLFGVGVIVAVLIIVFDLEAT